MFQIVLTMMAITQAPAPAAKAQTPAARAQAVVQQLMAGQFAAIEAQFTDQMKKALPEGRLATTWSGLTVQVGAFQKQSDTREEETGGLHIGIVTCAFERATLDVRVVFDQDGRIAGLLIRPTAGAAAPYALPSYADPASFTERDVTVGSGEWTLPGTLTLPKGDGPFAAVVLIHGSGPNDRDETVAANKPFRDLAAGLASRGVAVLRFDKRTSVYGARMAAAPELTVKEEVVDDALAAVAAARASPRIDRTRVFVLGHSLGGMLIPRIGSADPSIAGLIVMAGAARPLEQAMLEQLQYLAMADGTVSPDEQKAIDDARQTAGTVRALTPADAVAHRMISGAPASYWLDLRGYDPPSAAKLLTQPVLVLQGERDYQVTMDEFARWKAALRSKPGVTFKSYPALNHLMIPGTGRSLPAEYNTPGHVAQDVVDDIASWVAAKKR
jgi:dienelactone hydrolase